MDSELKNEHNGPDLEIEEDMLRLIQKFQISKLHYIDVSEQEKLKTIITHWPLIKELSVR
jgi:hypothetical protein